MRRVKMNLMSSIVTIQVEQKQTVAWKIEGTKVTEINQKKMTQLWV